MGNGKSSNSASKDMELQSNAWQLWLFNFVSVNFFYY